MAPLPIAVHNSVDAASVEATCLQLGLEVDEFRELQRQSSIAAEGAYCPYSKFPVGAAILTRYGISRADDSMASGTGRQGSVGSVHGRFILGANVENVAFPVGTCAERVALGRAVFEGHRDFKAIAVTATATPPGSLPTSPCGMCRQFIREFCDMDTPILMFSKNGNYVAVKLEALLPLSFGPSSLPTTGMP